MALNFKLKKTQHTAIQNQFVELLKTIDILSFGGVNMRVMGYMDKYIKRMDKNKGLSLQFTVVKSESITQRWEYSQTVVLLLIELLMISNDAYDFIFL